MWRWWVCMESGLGVQVSGSSVRAGHRAKGGPLQAPCWLQICLWTGTPPARPSLPAPLRLPFPRHLLMIAVPVVYNYQFDKFRSSLLIIIISFHSVRLREFNNNINNGGCRSGIDYKELTGKTSFCCQETHPRRGTCPAAPSVCPTRRLGLSLPQGIENNGRGQYCKPQV